MTKEIGLYPGSFRPFHNKHLEIVRSILNTRPTTDLIIAVSEGSDDRSNNFIDAKHARQITEAVIEAEHIRNRVEVYILDKNKPDGCRDFLLSKNVGVVFTGSASTQQALLALKRSGTWNGEVVDLDNSGIHGTVIRQLIIDGNSEWKKYVHPNIVQYLEKFQYRRW